MSRNLQDELRKTGMVGENNRGSDKKQSTFPKKDEDNDMKDSFVLSLTKLPMDTRNSGLTDIDNFYLKLNKAARFMEDKFEKDKDNKDEGNFEFYKIYKKSEDKNKSFEITPKFLNIPLAQINKRQSNVIESLEKSGYHIACMTFKPDWRMVIGLGNESVYETSMTLHHIYGIPYIPGSAIKGITRSWAITKCFDSKEEDALKGNDYCSKKFCQIFGAHNKEDESKNSQGHVIFFDAYPVALTSESIQVDIMTPHYKDYYGEGKKDDEDKKNKKGKWPTDDQDPNPIPFLTLKDVTFKIYLGMKNKDHDENHLKTAVGWLKEAFTEHGIGAKTAVGYGAGSITEHA